VTSQASLTSALQLQRIPRRDIDLGQKGDRSENEHAYEQVARCLACTRFRDTELGVLMELEVGHGATEVYPRVQA